jgi:putative zinc finger protein
MSLTCRESARLLSDNLGRTLSRSERVALQIHLVLCRRCRRFRDNLRVFRDLMGRMTEQCLAGDGPAAALAADQRARILATLARAQSQEFR